MQLLLIGHGYLGQAITREFLKNGWDVTAVSRSDDENKSQDSYQTRPADVGDPESITSLKSSIAPPDFIIHCAASGRGGPEAYQKVYVDGCRNLTAIFENIPLLFTSSTSVYAQTDGSEVTEESPAEPDRETGRLLLAAERLVLDAGGIVARLSGIYGPGRSVILKKFLNGEAMIEEDGRRLLNQVHRDDAARAIFQLAAAGKHRGGIFNVSDERPLAQIDCYQQLAEMFGRPMPTSGPRHPDRKRGWTHKRVSSAKLQATGWRPRYPSFIDAVPDL